MYKETIMTIGREVKRVTLPQMKWEENKTGDVDLFGSCSGVTAPNAAFTWNRSMFSLCSHGTDG